MIPPGSVVETVSVSRSEKSVGFHVAGAAEGDEIASVVCAAVGKGQLMMHLFGRLVDTVLQALLAQWMLTHISVTDSLPRSAVPFLCFRVTAVVVVLVVGCLFMRRAVKLTVVGKVRTARHTAWSFWFCWHWFTSFGSERGFVLKCIQNLFA